MFLLTKSLRMKLWFSSIAVLWVWFKCLYFCSLQKKYHISINKGNKYHVTLINLLYCLCYIYANSLHCSDYKIFWNLTCTESCNNVRKFLNFLNSNFGTEILLVCAKLSVQMSISSTCRLLSYLHPSSLLLRNITARCFQYAAPYLWDQWQMTVWQMTVVPTPFFCIYCLTLKFGSFPCGLGWIMNSWNASKVTCQAQQKNSSHRIVGDQIHMLPS